MPFSSFIRAFLISALVFGPAARASDCSQVLAAALQIHLNVNITIDPRTGHARLDSAYTTSTHESPRVIPQVRTISLGQVFHQLMDHNRLLAQTDYRLGQRQLLVQGGGLCGSTCAVNVLHAVARFTGVETAPLENFPEHQVNRIIDDVWQRFGSDARVGITADQIAAGLDSLAPQLGLRIRTHVRTASHYGPISLEELSPASNEIMILTVRSGRYPNGSPAYHALVLTGLNSAQGIASYSDPNHPHLANHVTARYAYGPSGATTVQLGIPRMAYGDRYEGCVESFVRVTVPGL